MLQLNRELRKLDTWLIVNRLSLNIAKTKFLVFHSYDKPIKQRITLKIHKKAISDYLYLYLYSSYQGYKQFSFSDTSSIDITYWIDKIIIKLGRIIFTKTVKDKLQSFNFKYFMNC